VLVRIHASATHAFRAVRISFAIDIPTAGAAAVAALTGIQSRRLTPPTSMV